MSFVVYALLVIGVGCVVVAAVLEPVLVLFAVGFAVITTALLIDPEKWRREAS